MINARAIKAQHPKKVGATSYTIKGRLSPFEEANTMTWRWAKDLAPNKLSNVAMVCESNLI